MTEPREIVLKKTLMPKGCPQCGSDSHAEKECKGIAPFSCPNCGTRIFAWEEVPEGKMIPGKIMMECANCNGEE